MKTRFGMISICAAAASGCTGVPEQRFDKPIPVAAITRQMKCEVARAIEKLKGNKDFNIRGWYISGTMTSNVITISGSDAGLGTPSLVPIGPTSAIGFSLSGDFRRSKTSKVAADFVISSHSVDSRICTTPIHGVDRVEGLGIYEWLLAYSTIPEGSPAMGITKLDFSLVYGVYRSGKLGATIQVMPIKATANAALSRDDTQTITMIFDPGEATRKAAAAYAARSGLPRRVRAPDGSSTVVIQSIGGETEVQNTPSLFVPQ